MGDTKATALDLVREMRVTGNYGHDLWIQSLDEGFGEAVVASRQLESSVTRIAAAWVDGSMDDNELWEFLESNLQNNVSEFAKILRDSFRESDAKSHGPIVEATCAFVTDLRSFNDKANWNFGRTSVAAVIAAMALRQLLEDTCNGGDGTKEFKLYSSNVAGEFLAACLAKMNSPPFQLDSGCTLNVAQHEIVSTLGEILS